MAHGKNIYIREAAYSEGSSATDAILLHELTHVLQYQRGMKFHGEEEVKAGEREADRNETLLERAEDPYYYAQIGDEVFYLNKRIEKEAIDYAVELLKDWLGKEVAQGNIGAVSSVLERLERRV
ncbi:eCIS core domain-containing protein [Breznakiella homolactica]|uniref:DUF4157 domain-containing protein n=1 Tax=Breznakiella homolactica TaxID=2798577 RepID=A0A7T7XMB5_9SPIR|nr:DUF4157 domain-containing protein [Breznakiella homolactica]QQO08994.1 DUF4157 domain-containing protein [Breznakiella homolactica]